MNTPTHTLDKLKREFSKKYNGLTLAELDIEGSELFLKILLADMEIKESTVSNWKFQNYYKPVIERRIADVKAHISKLEIGG